MVNAHAPQAPALKPLRVPFAAAFGLWLCLHAAGAGAGPRLPPVQPLHNGLNPLSLLVGAPAGMAVLAHRENFNAHSFDVLTIYQLVAGRPGGPVQWQIVPVMDERGEHLTLSASGGADCLLKDFRLLSPSAAEGARLILAERELGESFASPAPVSFRFYRLQRNGEGIAGSPHLFFAFDHEVQAAHPYCDVGEALQRELGVGPDRARP